MKLERAYELFGEYSNLIESLENLSIELKQGAEEINIEHVNIKGRRVKVKDGFESEGCRLDKISEDLCKEKLRIRKLLLAYEIASLKAEHPRKKDEIAELEKEYE